jgi:hypothetical protein
MNSAVLASKELSLNPGESRQVTLELPVSPVNVREDHTETFTLNFPYQVEFRPQFYNKDDSGWFDLVESSAVTVNVANVNVARNVRVGYIRGFDYSLPDALASLGVASKELSRRRCEDDDLSKYTSVIVDNRVYESKPELIAVNQKLLDYANAGGNLIVFYHKSDEWNPDETAQPSAACALQIDSRRRTRH